MNWYLIGFIYLLFALIGFLDTFLYDKIKNSIKKRERRRLALIKAKTFLKPYKKRFGELCLSNQDCSVNYLSGKTLFVFEKKVNDDGNKQSFVAQSAKFEILSMDEIWDALCNKFDYSTSLDDVLSICGRNGFLINRNYITTRRQQSKTELGIANEIHARIMAVSKNNELIDINTCSEAELTALPGINAITAKKIIKHREEAGTFDSVEDFIELMNIKPHFGVQIKELASANKVEKKKEKRIKWGRIVDI